MTASAPTPFRHTTRERVLDDIRAQIIDGRLAPGDRLVERALAEQLGVSRVPVREALHVLAEEGFAEHRVSGGIRVRAFSPDEVDELVEIRAALEPVVVRRAIRTLDDVGADQLRAALAITDLALAAGDIEAAIVANASFHEVLASLGQGSLTTDVLAGVSLRLRWMMHRHDDPTVLHEEHTRIVDAVIAKDEELALRLLAVHALTSRRALDDTLALGTATGTRRA